MESAARRTDRKVPYKNFTLLSVQLSIHRVGDAPSHLFAISHSRRLLVIHQSFSNMSHNIFDGRSLHFERSDRFVPFPLQSVPTGKENSGGSDCG